MVQTPQNPYIGPPVERVVVQSAMVFSGVGVICEICEDRGSGAGGGGGGGERSWKIIHILITVLCGEMCDWRMVVKF